MTILLCPRCSSTKLKKYVYMGAECFKCLNCSYDSCSDLDSFPTQRNSQREKRRFSPYKAGRK
ncbi:hypothetical protein J4482_04245 [Candidatus Woesearchaeota archaeon]|nr:hypothetical protein [Candidatus Woesearchaeota archaeon]